MLVGVSIVPARSSARYSFGCSSPVDRGARLAQLLLEPPQRALVAVEQLDLDLAEPAGDVLALEHGDAVVDDLGAVGEDPLAARAQAGHRDELGAAEVGRQERQHLGRRPGRRARQLELEPRRLARQLQLPEPGPVLDAMPEGDAVPRQPEVLRVVVGGDEDARREARAAELREYEALSGGKLDLALERLLHESKPR